MADGLRKLDAGSAWNDAVRRAIALSTAGFIAVGVLSALMGYAGQRNGPAFQWVLCGCAVVFLGSLALFMAYYHQRWREGVFAACVCLVTLVAVNFLWAQFFGPASTLGRAAAPTALSSLLLYFVLQRRHVQVSGSTMADYLSQLEADDFHATEKTWRKGVLILCVVVGLFVVVILLRR